MPAGPPAPAGRSRSAIRPTNSTASSASSGRPELATPPLRGGQLSGDRRPRRIFVDLVQRGAVQARGDPGKHERTDARRLVGRDHGQVRDPAREPVLRGAGRDDVVRREQGELGLPPRAADPCRETSSWPSAAEMVGRAAGRHSAKMRRARLRLVGHRALDRDPQAAPPGAVIRAGPRMSDQLGEAVEGRCHALAAISVRRRSSTPAEQRHEDALLSRCDGVQADPHRVDAELEAARGCARRMRGTDRSAACADDDARILSALVRLSPPPSRELPSSAAQGLRSGRTGQFAETGGGYSGSRSSSSSA